MNACATCQAELVDTEWGELCGACALGASLRDEQVLIGDYERFHLIGEGSMGAVYLAKHVASDEVVALKLAKRELVELPGGPELFRQQAKLESALVHPNIVHVQGAGTHGAQPFLVMPLMEGGTLAEAENAKRYADPAARLQLVLTIARAVQFAHERGVLHCDLKPENILFDAAGAPRVSDFGLARYLASSGVADADGVRGGTLGWMSPEQVRGGALTTASDVFALGVLLYWLDTGAPPFGDGADFETRVLEEPTPPLRPWTPELAWGLQAVAHRALKKDPEERYASAAALVDDLERLATGRSPRGALIPIWGRCWYWAQRHPGARNAIFLLLPGFALLTSFMATAQRADLRQAVLDMNAYAASGQAAAVLYQLRDYAAAVERAAADPAVRALTHGPRRVANDPGANACANQLAFEDGAPLTPYAERFATFLVLDSSGCPRARVPDGPDAPSLSYLRTSFDWRDYFANAMDEAGQPKPATHVRKAYRSAVSQLIKFAVSAPLFEDGKWVGVVAGSMTAASTLGVPRMKRSETHDQITVLLGPYEGERTGPEGTLTAPGANEFTFLAHPQLGRGEKVILDGATTAALQRAFHQPHKGTPQFELSTAEPLVRPDYRDPLLQDSFLAAFAPVGATGYVVLVQTRDSVAIRPSNGLSRSALALTIGSVTLILLYGTFFTWRWRRERPG